MWWRSKSKPLIDYLHVREGNTDFIIQSPDTTDARLVIDDRGNRLCVSGRRVPMWTEQDGDWVRTPEDPADPWWRWSEEFLTRTHVADAVSRHKDRLNAQDRRTG